MVGFSILISKFQLKNFASWGKIKKIEKHMGERDFWIHLDQFKQMKVNL
jgi:hypothetical protein